ncbi:ATP-binding protein [Ignavibacteria bacterium]|nr:ATP-binding protein [Bacteroidota bacterium]MCZ2132871.1 ATP-binding protein [Bacteroidota bacterium]
MRRNELREIIAAGESSTVEFKRKFTSGEKIAKEISAFANTKGGLLIIGVDDDKRITGIRSEKEEIAQVEHACAFFIEPVIEPFIEIVEIEYKDVVVAHIAESAEKPHQVVAAPDEPPHKRKVYIRQGEESVTASREMIRILRGQRPDAAPVRLSIGDKERRLFQFLEANKRTTIKEFAHLVNISDRRASQLLVRLVRAGALNIHTNEDKDYYTLI